VVNLAHRKGTLVAKRGRKTTGPIKGSRVAERGKPSKMGIFFSRLRGRLSFRANSPLKVLPAPRRSYASTRTFSDRKALRK
jgi:hypothetical protein